jgi:hypothetical protein
MHASKVATQVVTDGQTRDAGASFLVSFQFFDISGYQLIVLFQFSELLTQKGSLIQRLITQRYLDQYRHRNVKSLLGFFPFQHGVTSL